MSDIKCPICQNNLHKINIVVSTCKNDKCKLWGSSIPNLVLEALEKTNQDLERTRKALKVGVDALDAGRTLARIAGFEMLAAGLDEAVKKITTLEQKE